MGELNEADKAAVLLHSLTPPLMEAVLGQLDTQLAGTLRTRVQQLQQTPQAAEVIERVLGEFDQHFQQRNGAPEPAAKVPEQREPAPAPAAERQELPAKAADPEDARNPLGALNKLEPERLALALEGENARTVSLVLNYLEIDRAGAVFKRLPPEIRREVSVQMGTAVLPGIEVAQRIAAALVQKSAAVKDTAVETRGDARYKKMADMLRKLDKADRMEVLAGMQERDAALAAAVKEHLYLFEDLLLMDNRSIQKILAEVDSRSLATALKGAADEIKAKVLANLSQRAREALAEEMEFLGSTSAGQVQQAQKMLVEVVQRLDQAGEVTIG